MIFIMNFIPSNFQILKIISVIVINTFVPEWSVKWWNGWFEIRSTGTNTNSRNLLKSSKGYGVKIGSKSGSKSRSWNSSPHSFSHNRIWLSKLVIQVQEWQVWEWKLTLKYCSNRVAKQQLILIQKFKLDHKFENLGHIFLLSSIS